VKRNAVAFFGGHFLWSVFRASLGNLGKNPLHPKNLPTHTPMFFNT